MQSLTKQTLRIFWNHSKKYRWQISVLVFGVAIVIAVQTYFPFLYKALIDSLVDGLETRDPEPAIKIVILLFIINFIRTTTWRAAIFVNNYFQSRVMADLINTCYKYLQKHSYGFFSSRFVGSLVTKVKRYERSFEQIADQIIFDFGRVVIETIVVLIVLLWQYRFFGVVMLSWSVAYMIFVYFFSMYKLQYDIHRADTDTQSTARLADSITNNINIKLFSNYRRENQGFEEVTDEQFRARKKSWNLGNVAEIIQGFAMVVLEFIIMYFSVKMWSQGVLTVGDVTLLQAYFLRLVEKLWGAGKNIQKIYESLADANEMTELLLMPHSVQDKKDAKELVVKEGKIEFVNSTFGYHDKSDVLKAFNLTAAPGERVALIGPSGGGKSTIIKVLLRFYDLKSGEVKIDGQNIGDITQDSLREAISFVPQDPILFHRSLKENIRYAKPDATEEEVIRAAKLAHAHEFIENLQFGYDTLVGERGIKLSGGERQRVAIARAILKDAPILVLDEATSSLDSESEMLIQDALKELMKNRTTIVIAHRLSTIMQMDRIVVIADGKILEQGKHEELLKVQQGTYQRLWDIQAGGFATAQ